MYCAYKCLFKLLDITYCSKNKIIFVSQQRHFLNIDRLIPRINMRNSDERPLFFLLPANGHFSIGKGRLTTHLFKFLRVSINFIARHVCAKVLYKIYIFRGMYKPHRSVIYAHKRLNLTVRARPFKKETE